jgi:hypothetical protein
MRLTDKSLLEDIENKFRTVCSTVDGVFSVTTDDDMFANSAEVMNCMYCLNTSSLTANNRFLTRSFLHLSHLFLNTIVSLPFFLS